MMNQIDEVVSDFKWPKLFGRFIAASKDNLTSSYVILDNSRSMVKRDGHRLTIDEWGNQR